MANLPIDLAKAKEEIEEIAKSYGLDFFPTIFEVLEFDDLNQVAAYGGFPKRYPHWSFGMDYEELSKGYEYGLSKIYEMVINTNPCYAYLMKSNPLVDQKLVMAHVYAHCDFFKNNYWFSKTNRKMMDEMANHATKVRRYIDRYGFESVESFIDICKSLENLIDVHLPFIEPKTSEVLPDPWADLEATDPLVPKLKSKKEYMDSFINPPEFLEEQKQKIIAQALKTNRFPSEPQKDVLDFLINYGRIEPWQRDVLSMIREEAYYFAPQAQTKIMNEGWASYWHSTMMTQKILKDSEIIDYADHHSGTLATSPGRLNPYKLGIELFKDIEERWNKGQFGKDYDDCTDREQKSNWNKNLGLGREKIFQVRKIYNDITFLDEFLTEDFCIKNKMFTFGLNQKSKSYEIISKEFKSVKSQLLSSLTNMGRPYITVENGNFENKGELLLFHRHEGIDLKLDWAKHTLGNIFFIWKRPVHLKTLISGKTKILSFDGNDFKEKDSEHDAPTD